MESIYMKTYEVGVMRRKHMRPIHRIFENILQEYGSFHFPKNCVEQKRKTATNRNTLVSFT